MKQQDRTINIQNKIESLLLDLLMLSTKLGEWPDYNDGVFFNKPGTELASPHIRNEYLIKTCRDKKVLHFGFVDSPFTKERIDNGSLLHRNIAEISQELWGADIDDKSVKIYENITGDKNCWVIDICNPLLEAKLYNKSFDIILFGEILEHLLNPGIALMNLYKLCKINKAKLIITTPNAFNSAGFIAALMGNEIVHPEHYYYYSPITLKRLLTDCGFKNINISFYAGSNTTESPGLTFPGLIAECET
jgi:hypothetical protein